MKCAPIIVFAYNRPHYLHETLEALNNNKEAAESDLFIYCDGPAANTSEKNLGLIKQVRELAHSKQWCKNVIVKESLVNKGLANSVTEGITDVINKYGKVIVLEDDIVIAPFFLKYMNEALEKYKNEEKVAEISGYNYPLKNLKSDGETFFLKAISCWGWATWQRAWKLYDHDASKLLLELQNGNLEKEFDFDNTFGYTKMLKMTIDGKVDSWFIKWYASCFLQNKLTLYPSKSLVKNIGMVGTHIVGDNRDFLGDEYNENSINDFEKEITQNSDMRLKWQHHYKRYNRKKLNFRNIKYAISKIRLKYK